MTDKTTIALQSSFLSLLEMAGTPWFQLMLTHGHPDIHNQRQMARMQAVGAIPTTLLYCAILGFRAWYTNSYIDPEDDHHLSARMLPDCSAAIAILFTMAFQADMGRGILLQLENWSDTELLGTYHGPDGMLEADAISFDNAGGVVGSMTLIAIMMFVWGHLRDYLEHRYGPSPAVGEYVDEHRHYYANTGGSDVEAARSSSDTRTVEVTVVNNRINVNNGDMELSGTDKPPAASVEKVQPAVQIPAVQIVEMGAMNDLKLTAIALRIEARNPNTSYGQTLVH